MIYLDYQATTPLAPEAAAAMRPWLETRFANPHSSHRAGREAAAAVEVARERVAAALGPRGGEGALYFTSGATEAINWALKGASARLSAERRRIVTLATEHAAVLDTVRWLAAQGFEVEILRVEPDGLVDLARVASVVDESTGLVAAMLVNNEIGVVQPIAEIAAMARRRGALFLCDAVQGLGRSPLPVEKCDMIALSAHKVHGPKGIGALWVRQGVEIDALLHGGGQEGGLRSGTLSPALCVGFGEAARLLDERRDSDDEHVGGLWALATELMPGWMLNGSAVKRYKGNLSLRRAGVDAARLISELRGVAFSAGSACASGSGRPSHVLSALGISEREARSTIRLGFGRYTSESELRDALIQIDAAASRQLSFAA
ncbi:MAG TPA: cysteine desulfurase family protein [Allosphingosinicella sp.]|nr:cysteine desulfurase family protein [Allosphingosinicella sp.]